MASPDAEVVEIRTPDEARAKLAELGQRRQRMEDEDAEVADLIRQALAKSEGMVSKTEAAALLGMHRTTLYRVYGNDD